MEDKKDFVVWGDGKQQTKIFNQKKYIVVPEISKKRLIEKLYLKDEVALYIANGELIKEGKFEFEKKFKSTAPNKQPVFCRINNILVQPIVSQIAFGDSHVLILSLQGQVFTWGDNYYGQLGQANPFMVMSKDPVLVNKIEVISSITAYENTSFAISTNKRLWVWGNNKYLGTEFKGNLFRPFQSHSNYLFHKLKVNNGKFIAKTTMTQESLNVAMGFKESNFQVKNMKNDEIREGLDGGSNENYLIGCFKKINKIVNDLFVKYDNNSYVLEEIREAIGAKRLSIDKKFLIETYGLIKKLFSEEKFLINKNVDRVNNMNNISNNKIIDVFSVVINSTIQNFLNKLKLDELLESISSLDKESLKVVNDIFFYEFKEAKDVKNKIQVYTTRLRSLVKNYSEYKKLEYIGHYLSALESLLSIYDFNKIILMIKEEIIEVDEDIFRKVLIIEKIYESMKYLEENLNIRLQKLENTLGNISKMNIKEINSLEEESSSKIIYKYMIDSFNKVKSVWSLNYQSIEGISIQKEKINHLSKLKQAVHYLYGCHQYMNTINFADVLELFFNRENLNNDLIHKDNQLLIGTIIKCLAEIELILNKLTQVISIKKENRSNSDYYSNEILVMYCSSILDQAYLKRILLILCYSILLSKKHTLQASFDDNESIQEKNSQESIDHDDDY